MINREYASSTMSNRSDVKKHFNSEESNVKRYLSMKAREIYNQLSKKRPLVHDDIVAGIFENLKYKGKEPLEHIVSKIGNVSATDFIGNMIYSGYGKTARVLVSEFADETDLSIGCYLHLAARSSEEDVIKDIFLRAEALGLDKLEFINNLNEEGDTALHIATGYGRIRIVKSLLNNGADVNAVDKQGNTSRYIAILRGYDDIARILKYEEKAVAEQKKKEDKEEKVLLLEKRREEKAAKKAADKANESSKPKRILLGLKF